MDLPKNRVMFKLVAKEGKVLAIASANKALKEMAMRNTTHKILPINRGEAIAHYRKGAYYIA